MGAGVGRVTHAPAVGRRHAARVDVACGLRQHRAAVRAELGFGAGGRRAGLVRLGGDGLIAGDAAGFADILLHTRADAAGRDEDLSAVPAVACRLGGAVRIGFAAALADVERHATRRAGGRDDLAPVAVASSFGEVGDPALAADRAFLHGVAGSGAGGSHGGALPLVPRLFCGDLSGLAAGLADLQALAAVRAVGLADHHGLPDVPFRADIVPVLPQSAERAVPAVIARGGAGGRGCLDEAEVVDAVRAVKLSAMGAVAAVAAGAAHFTAAADTARQLRGVAPQPDPGHAVFLHADALAAVGNLVIDAVLSGFAVGGRDAQGALVGAVAVAHLDADAGLGEVGHGDAVGLSVHRAEVVRHHGLGRQILPVRVVALCAVGDDGEALPVQLREHVGVQRVALQTFRVAVAGAVAEGAAAPTVRQFPVVVGVHTLIRDRRVQLLREGRGAVVEQIDVFAEGIGFVAAIGIQPAACFAHGLGPVITGVRGVDAGLAVQDRARAGAVQQGAVREADAADQGGLPVPAVLRGAPDRDRAVHAAEEAMGRFVCYNRVDIQLVGAVGGAEPVFRRVMIAVLLPGQGRQGEQRQRQKHCQQQGQQTMRGAHFLVHSYLHSR